VVGQSEELTELIPHTPGSYRTACRGQQSKKNCGSLVTRAGPLRSWAELAGLGQTSERLSLEVPPCIRASPPPFPVASALPDSGDNAARLGGLGVITNRFHIQIQLVEEKLLLLTAQAGVGRTSLNPRRVLQGAWGRDRAGEEVPSTDCSQRAWAQWRDIPCIPHILDKGQCPQPICPIRVSSRASDGIKGTNPTRATRRQAPYPALTFPC
jgi:hypothetical protein